MCSRMFKLKIFNFLVFLAYACASDLKIFQEQFENASTPDFKEEHQVVEQSGSELNKDENFVLVSVLGPDVNTRNTGKCNG